MENEIQKFDNTLEATPFSKRFESLLDVSSRLIKSGMLPEAYKFPEQVAMVILKGRELKLPEMATLQGMFPVGRGVGMSVQIMMTLIRRHPEFSGYDYKFEPNETNPTSCIVTMRRKEETKSWTFSITDASKAKLIKPDGNYDKWMKNMLLNRATANCARTIFPDALMGMYLVEELDPSMIIDAEPTEETAYAKEPIEIFNQAKQALEKAKKSFKLPDLEAWYELYKDDVVKLPPNFQGVLERDYKAAYSKLKPKVEPKVENVNPANSAETKDNKAVTDTTGNGGTTGTPTIILQDAKAQ
jgi:hypothetical protein